MRKKKCTTCMNEFDKDAFYTFKRKNKDSIKLYAICKECHKKTMKEYQGKQKYKDWNKNYQKEYRIKNKESILKYQREYKRIRRARDKIFLLQERISTQVCHQLKGRTIHKEGSFWMLVKYSITDLKIHLENQFLDGMNWDNYGDWHVDHIKPKSKFNIKVFGDEEFMKCWALDNMQPLWRADNLFKSNKYSEEY